MRRYALREDDLTLDKLLLKARSLEESEKLATGMEKLEVNKQSQESVRRVKQQFVRANKESNKVNHDKQCFRCGRTHSKIPCPAKGKFCHKCGKPNHFAKMCRGISRKPDKGRQQQSSQIHQITTTTEESLKSGTSEEEYIYTLVSKRKVPGVLAKIDGVPIQMTIDTGASTDY